MDSKYRYTQSILKFLGNTLILECYELFGKNCGKKIFPHIFWMIQENIWKVCQNIQDNSL